MMSNQPVPGVPGAEIRFVDTLPETLEGAHPVAPYSVARPGALLRVVPGVGRFLARDGSLIEVCPDAGADPMAVLQLLHGAVRAALIYQRGGFALHAACLVAPGQADAVAIAGRSGAGKSTLARELVRRGWSLLGDDLTAIYKGPEGLMAWPSRDGIKLWRDACEGFAIDVRELDRLPGERDKYLLPIAMRQEPARVRAIYFLDRTGSSTGQTGCDGVFPIAGPERLAVLTRNSYRRMYVAALGWTQGHFELTCAMAEELQLAHLRHGGGVSACADVLGASVRAGMDLQST